MLDIKLFRDEPDRVRTGLAAKHVDPTVVDRVRELDESRRAIVTERDAAQARKNELSAEIPRRAKAGEDIAPLREESKNLGPRIEELSARLKTVEDELDGMLMTIPNLPHPSAPKGRSADDNVVVRTWGEAPRFDFEPKAHWDLADKLGIIDFARASKLSGSGFILFKGPAARLERLLINWFLDVHTTRNGYTEVSPPFLVSSRTMTGTGQLPKFADDLYRLQGEDLWLVPTAEVPVTNIHYDEILEASQLPVKYCAYTPCFRREAGTYGKETRGITRVHQFDKVELVHFSLPEASEEAHEALTAHAAGLMEELGLHYRVLNLCVGDMSFGAAKCYDLEIWAPGMKAWLEVSSCSNFWDFQARRAKIRFRRERGGKTEFVHTLNGSGLALPRLMIALIETGQQPDGSIKLPPTLAKLYGSDIIPGTK